jgi:enediyne biosynthesis protein E5
VSETTSAVRASPEPRAAADESAGASRGTRRRRVDPRWFSSSLLTLILVIGQWKFQILGDGYVPWLVALGSAVLTELVLFRLHTRRWPNLLSAYISGNSVAILTKPEGSLLWPFWFGGVISILSKYVLRFRGRHLWNPTNFAVCVLLLLAPDRVSILGHQWGNAPAMVAVIWLVGSVTAYFARVYQLFLFFMITDPRTIVAGRTKQVAVTSLVALVECAIRLAVDFDVIAGSNPLATAPPMFALFVVGPLALAIDLVRNPRGHGTG